MEQALETNDRTPSSQVLRELLERAPAEHFTLGWLTSQLHQQSFSIIMLFLGLLATVPVGSMIPGIMLAALAVQMVGGRVEPVFPSFIADRRLPTRHLLRLGERAIPVLQYLEKAVHPRWPATFEASRRVIGIVILLLTAILLLTPVPLSNVIPAMVIALVSLAHIEHDGLLLAAGLLAAVVVITLAAVVWGTVVSATLIGRVW